MRQRSLGATLSPSLAEIRRGVLYVGLENDVLKKVVDVVSAPKRDAITNPLAFAAGMGPRLFWNVDEGKWIPWNVEAFDENEDRPVVERPWPFCWGDVVWALAQWEQQPVFLRWEQDFLGELYLGAPRDLIRPGEGASLLSALVAAEGVAEKHLLSTYGLMSLDDLTPFSRFWRGKAPKSPAPRPE